MKKYMKNIILSTTAITSLSILIPSVLADTGDMMGFGMMGSMGSFGMGLFGLVYFIIAAFVFSLIFWWTYTLIVKKKR